MSSGKVLFDGLFRLAQKEPSGFLGHHARSGFDHGKAERRAADAAPEPAAALDLEGAIGLDRHGFFSHCGIELHATV